MKRHPRWGVIGQQPSQRQHKRRQYQPKCAEQLNVHAPNPEISRKKKGSQAPFFNLYRYAYLQDEGAHLAGVPIQVQLAMDVLEILGVKTTEKSFAALILPVTVTIPVVAPTVMAVARAVGTKLVPQASRLTAPTVETASVMQVRAPLAARMTSDALARAV